VPRVRVAILAGGRSSEHDISLASARSVLESLDPEGYEVVTVAIGRDGRWELGTGDGSVAETLPVPTANAPATLGSVDVVLPILHGPFGEDGTVQGLLELLDVPYVGAGVLASSLCMDKIVFKDVLAAAGVPQVAYAGVREARWRAQPATVRAELASLGLPLFVKPARLGSSVGIAKVRSADELDGALDGAFAHDELVIVEAFSGGIEVECSVLGNGAPEASVPGEIVLRGADWYDYEAKYTAGAMELVAPARLPGEVADEVRRLACETFLRVGCSGLARVDFFVEGERVLVNELNTLPGFTATSVYPKLWEVSGLAFHELCDRLLGLAVERFGARQDAPQP
jgi:D-alanine-D-alanine ligase